MHCLLGLVSFLFFCFFLFQIQVFRSQNHDFFSRPNFPKQNLFSETKFSETETETFFWHQLLRNRNRDFFSETKFSETKTETFFRNQILRDRNRNPSKNWQKSRNREVSKPKCQFLPRGSGVGLQRPRGQWVGQQGPRGSRGRSTGSQWFSGRHSWF